MKTKVLVKAEIEKVLGETSRPLHAHEIVRSVRFSDPLVDQPSVQNELLLMLKERVVEQVGKRYLLKNKVKSVLDISINQEEGRPSWDAFKALCNYYIDCLRAKEGAVAVSKLSDLNERFISRPLLGVKSPSLDIAWKHTYALDPDLASLLSNKKEDDKLVFGYPVFKVSEEDGLIVPIFCFKVDVNNIANRVELSSENPAIFINPRFIQSLKNEKISDNRVQAFRNAAGDFSAEMQLSFWNLAEILQSFFPELCGDEQLMPNQVSEAFLSSGSGRNKIANTAVLMLAKRPVYSLRLINELECIAKEDEEVLSKTALSAFFGDEPVEESSKESVLSTTNLNYSQRCAADSIISSSLSTITGPPGSGKSQVVSTVAAHCFVKRKSMLFSSYNHKALDAVCERTKIPDKEDFSYLRRFNTQDNPEALRLGAIIDEIHERDDRAFLKERYEDDFLRVETISNENAELFTQMESLSVIEKEVNELERRLEDYLRDFDANLFAGLLSYRVRSVVRYYRSLADSGLFNRLVRFYYRVFRPKFVKRCRVLFDGAAPSKEEARRILRCVEVNASIKEKKKSLPNLDITDISDRYNNNQGELESLLPKLIEARIDEPFPEQAILSRLKVNIRAWRRELARGNYRPDWVQEVVDGFKDLLRHYSGSAVSSLSVAKAIPLLPAVFDFAIIDEASVSDFPSAIPLFFRARKAAVVGDPHQLPPIIKIREDLEERFRIANGLTQPWTRYFNYKQNSLFDVSEVPKNSYKIFLSDNYRSDASIVEYSNAIQYKNRINPRAYTSTLQHPATFKRGIQWENVKTTIRASTDNFSIPEIERVVEIVKRILDEKRANFQGTVGVITPFRKQAQLISDRLEKEFSVEQREKHKLLAQTVHAFQGGERDCIVFSLCGGDFLRDGARAFIEKDSRIFNVATSRARATLIVVGDKEWAKASTFNHINLLVEASEGRLRSASETEWAPYESPWEKKLALKLEEMGLKPIPQHPVSNRRLDLALIDENTKTFLDVEVDGCAYHRRTDGTRRTEDLWRNYQLRSMGWNVIRFWVYELRDDLDKCAKLVKDEFERSRGDG